MTQNEGISFQRKYGLRLLQILIILVAFFLVRNCILMLGGDIPSEQRLNQYYEMGYEAGKSTALGRRPIAEPNFSDPLLKKRYRDGYRSGWDNGRNSK